LTLSERLKTIQPIALVALLTVFMHVWAVAFLPQDFDEPVYLQNAFDYARSIQSGDINQVIDYTGTQEHPAFIKLLYAGTILALGKAATFLNAFFASRVVSAFFGILAVLFITLGIDPLAGGMLALHTLAVKYTSQVYLEAVPLSMTIAAVLLLVRTNGKKPDHWFWLSSIALGIAGASKYSYLPVIMVVLIYLAIAEKKIKFNWLLLYGILSVAIFFILNVHLWHDPVNRLIQSFTYHVSYSQGQHVSEVGYPWYQPLIWIFTSPGASWHPNIFFYYGFDGLISILAVAGIKWEWKERRWLVVWLIAGILFLLFWPTKWPQYSLTIVPALCIMGAESLHRLVRWIRTQDTYWGYLKEMLPAPSKWLWFSIGVFVLFIAGIYLSAAIKQAVGRIGWSSMTKENSFLPSNIVYALLPLEDGKILIGTEKGAEILDTAQTSDAPSAWTIFSTANSGLNSDRVLSLARDMDGTLWFGTANGVNSFDGVNWSSFTAEDMGLIDAYVLSLTASPDGLIYAGTLEGAVFWDGFKWNTIAEMQGNTVFALLVDAGRENIWFGTESGVSQSKFQNGTWMDYPTEEAVKNLMLDSSGSLWIATSGAGLARLDGSAWKYYKISNSGIPYNNVNFVAEVEPGQLWLGTSSSADVGGAAATFDGSEWHTFWINNSGTSGAEVTAIAVESGRVWMGTRTKGIDLFLIGSNK
jgi:hypothetical protein